MTMQNRRRQPKRAVLSLEALGTRIVPAITTAFLNGELTVTGDNVANSITLTIAGNDDVLLNTNWIDNGAGGHVKRTDVTKLVVKGEGGPT